MSSSIPTSNHFEGDTSTFTLCYDQDNFATELPRLFRENGVVVIEGVFTDGEADRLMDSLVGSFEKLTVGMDRSKIKTWQGPNALPQTRPGLFQALMSNIPPVWEIRSNDRVFNIFRTLYTNLRRKGDGDASDDNEVDDLIVSSDGVNVMPNGVMGASHDWAHLDQTSREDIFKCVQGQAVLTNTTACFRASPRSHLVLSECLTEMGVAETNTSNWAMLREDKKEAVRNLVQGVEGGQWQIPIETKKGSFIVWASSVIHSARGATRIEKRDRADVWKGWRGVVYVCLRPRCEFTQEELARRKNVFDDNRTTSHWSTKIQKLLPGGRKSRKEDYSKEIQQYINNPKLVYDVLGKPVLSSRAKRLCGFDG
eukprot:TRINITY_DN16995_c0_g1_i1.p1 TRINITY_DN16995_c0_g1~~TRINITY_DN16995_c0_g1_i1.p1  ORF type:complete len:368 (-),score=55.62 TRINITY_DN16995_c0_g1_i1:59-1162(-)